MNVQDTQQLSPEAQDALWERVVQALLTQRMTVSVAARTFGVHHATVSSWWNRFQRRGPDSFCLFQHCK